MTQGPPTCPYRAYCQMFQMAKLRFGAPAPLRPYTTQLQAAIECGAAVLRLAPARARAPVRCLWQFAIVARRDAYPRRSGRGWNECAAILARAALLRSSLHVHCQHEWTQSCHERQAEGAGIHEMRSRE
jgi:hypothetical protein